MRPEKYQAVAQIVSAILAKPGNVAPGTRANPQEQAEGFTLRMEEGKIFLYGGGKAKMTLEELIQYVDRYLG